MSKALVSYSDSDGSNSPNHEYERSVELFTDEEVRADDDGGDSQEHSMATATGPEVRNKLPVPGAILGMFDDDNYSTNTSAEHEGRTRSFPHVRGNWASFVFVPALLLTAKKSLLEHFSVHLKDVLSDKEVTVHSFPLGELHISLSRTVTLPFHWIDPLVTALRESFSKYKAFTIDFGKLACYSNDDKTRSFLGLEVDQGHEQLCKMVEEVNDCFTRYTLPKFYENPSLHVSLYWCLGDHILSLDSKTKAHLQGKWNDLVLNWEDTREPDQVEINVTSVGFKSGNKLFSFDLA